MIMSFFSLEVALQVNIYTTDQSIGCWLWSWWNHGVPCQGVWGWGRGVCVYVHVVCTCMCGWYVYVCMGVGVCRCMCMYCACMVGVCVWGVCVCVGGYVGCGTYMVFVW